MANDTKFRNRQFKSVGTRPPRPDGLDKVTGRAKYGADTFAPGQLIGLVLRSPHAHAEIKRIDTSKAEKLNGVKAVITSKDLPDLTNGDRDLYDTLENCMARDRALYDGHAVAAVAAIDAPTARKALKLIRVTYKLLPHVTDVDEAMKPNAPLVQPRVYTRGVSPKPKSPSNVAKVSEFGHGDVEAGFKAADVVVEKSYKTEQAHQGYIEPHACTVTYDENGQSMVWCCTQGHFDVRTLTAKVLGMELGKLKVIASEIGGGFGGKETQAAPWACMAALFVQRLERPVKLRLARQDDMVMTGKRHDFYNEYRVGFDDNGKLLGSDIMVAGMCGYSPDLSDAIVDRAMFHSDNAYNLQDTQVVGHRCKTHTVSNTAFRGFGGPQGTVIAEYIMDDIARAVGRDPLDVRKENLYQDGDKTHYGQTIEHYLMPELIEQLEIECNYRARRDAITKFNSENTYKKRGLALTPVKFGISFTVQFLNQAGALVHVYTDGSVHLNHGGTEMGQGLFTKVAQVVANEFEIDLDMVMVSSTNTNKVPNTSPTAASSGTDLNGKAAQNACQTIKARLVEFACRHYDVNECDVRFENNHVVISTALKEGEDEQWIGFGPFVEMAYMARISLSSTGYYSTPKIHYNRDKAQGRPFFYYAMGASCSEVEIDTLTGEYDVLRTDIIHDVGKSLNEAIDIGQIEGGFVQGMGWLTTEELSWNNGGRLISNGPASYKIPTAADVPHEFNTRLFDRPNEEETIYNSKAVGEPPLMLGMSVWLALRDAAASVSDYKVNPPMDTPATPERVLDAVNFCKENA